MGSGDWFKTLINRRKSKQERSKKLKGPVNEKTDVTTFGRCSSKKNVVGKVLTEDAAAIRIQTAVRVYKARKTLRSLKVMKRLLSLTENNAVIKQASTTLQYLQSWNRIQTQISARRLCMVTEGRIKQRKLESQIKIEAKLQDLEMDWCGGSETMEEIIGRIQQREEAAVKRERAMAYAFTHQWRANSGQGQGQFTYEFGKENWGWSWMERWIAARPWETRLPTQSKNPCKMPEILVGKVVKKAHSTVQKSNTAKTSTSNGGTLARRVSYPIAAKRTFTAETDTDRVNLSRSESNGETKTQGPQMNKISG